MMDIEKLITEFGTAIEENRELRTMIDKRRGMLEQDKQMNR